MDMSFSFDEAVPLSARALDFAELMAGIRDARGTAPRGGPALPSGCASLASSDATTLLAGILLGRPGWCDASRALGGRFADFPYADGTASAGQA